MNLKWGVKIMILLKIRRQRGYIGNESGVKATGIKFEDKGDPDSGWRWEIK